MKAELVVYVSLDCPSVLRANAFRNARRFIHGAAIGPPGAGLVGIRQGERRKWFEARCQVHAADRCLPTVARYCCEPRAAAIWPHEPCETADGRDPSLADGRDGTDGRGSRHFGSRLPSPVSRLPAPVSRFPIPGSRVPIPAMPDSRCPDSSQPNRGPECGLLSIGAGNDARWRRSVRDSWTAAADPAFTGRRGAHPRARHRGEAPRSSAPTRGILLQARCRSARPSSLVAFDARTASSRTPSCSSCSEHSRSRSSGVAAISPGWGMALTGVGEATRAHHGPRARPNLLDVLGVRPDDRADLRGRASRRPATGDGRDPRACVAVAERFGSDRSDRRPDRLGARRHALHRRRRSRSRGLRGARPPCRAVDPAGVRPRPRGSIAGAVSWLDRTSQARRRDDPGAGA